ncbi:TPA: tetrathionate reductase subunit TtrA [Yersinia enterocolitica]|uniref:tetrathionate reductase subunit TtrA n=1 Tax=Yersinia enterocolitica TaxID=630 RepID=UPI0028B27E2A|nr:tetrathionate reductase subunit TtrA [Yersinia enterocolitica]ELI8441043.1 tetrathionate reductase subunit TtrA [Yersinia enterocolitica]ELW8974494.1 tetrathionate reductase subunit TtrA [Yersinia enterocolitica]HDL6611387.1 tetrathionate reductase subunit TtrA [Yersinia enterocolitica]HDM8323355.1 tetrathionate reductase subunit TtrA [Yersinia enterocolitica]
MAKSTRRQWLKGSLALGGVVAFGASYHAVARKTLAGLVDGSAGKLTLDPISGNALPTEGRVGPQWQANPQQAVSMTQCFGCWTLCGLRVRVDTQQNKILRIAGNPYHPLSHDHHFPYQLPIGEAMQRLGGEQGMTGRSTACARGATLLEGVDSPYRITEPMKRVGPRGSGKWQRISFEQLVAEVTEGGDLFGEGPVEGLRAIRDLDTPIDAKQPSLGPKANQLLVTNAGDDGRDAFIQRFAHQAFGTKNLGSHGAYCGLAYRAGSGALMGDLDKNAHVKPDWDNVRFALFLGTSPAQSGNPFKRQGRQLANARQRDDFNYVVVAPALPLTTTLANQHNRWVPVLPGTDAALAMGIICWIIEQHRFNHAYLVIPGEMAMQAAGERSWTNASHLVITTETHPLAGQFLRANMLSGEPVAEGEESPVLAQAIDGALQPAAQMLQAELFVTQDVTLHDGQKVQVQSGMTCLQQAAARFTLAEYSQQCGVPEATIICLAREFTAYQRQAAVISHGGMMGGNGFYTTWAVMMLNAMIGNLNLKGGVSVGGGKFDGFADGPRYQLATFVGMVKPKGLPLSRSKQPYEKSEEYQQKIQQGQSGYPARGPWYPFVGGQLTEQLAPALAGYPYRLKAWISHMTNPLYGVAGLRNLIEERLQDPRQLPLFIAIDAFMNETTALADYIVPDTHNFESWGFSAPWAGVLVKASTARWPVVEPRTARTAQGEPVAMESFLIAVAKAMKLPGFGANAMQDSEGNSLSLDRAEDYYLRAAANIAYGGEKPLPAAVDDELRLTGVDRLWPALQRSLYQDEQRRVAYLLARGGRFAPYEKSWNGDATGPQWKKPLQIWNENVAKHHHAITGERYSGCPTWYPPRLADGSDVFQHYPVTDWPLRLMSFKSHLMSSSTAMIERLRAIKSTNLVAINPQDAQRNGIQHGDIVRLMTPGGQMEVQVSLLDGVMPGVVAIEHGYGHREMGTRAHTLDGVVMASDPRIGQGTNLNDLGFTDPTREVPNTWLDWVSGAAVRQGLPAKLQRIS